MAVTILETAPTVVGEVVDLISGIINENKDKDVRNGWTQKTLGKACRKFPDKYVIIVWTKHNVSGLQGCVQADLMCPCLNDNKTMKYKCYIIDSGHFHLQGGWWLFELGFLGKI